VAERPILEAVEPHPLTYDTTMLATGVPGVPRQFDWRGETFEVEEILDAKKELTVDRGDAYVRRHVVTIRTICGKTMKLAGARGLKSGRAPRWILRSIVEEIIPGEDEA